MTKKKMKRLKARRTLEQRFERAAIREERKVQRSRFTLDKNDVLRRLKREFS